MSARELHRILLLMYLKRVLAVDKQFGRPAGCASCCRISATHLEGASHFLRANVAAWNSAGAWAGSAVPLTIAELSWKRSQPTALLPPVAASTRPLPHRPDLGEALGERAQVQRRRRPGRGPGRRRAAKDRRHRTLPGAQELVLAVVANRAARASLVHSRPFEIAVYIFSLMTRPAKGILLVEQDRALPSLRAQQTTATAGPRTPGRSGR